MSRNCRFAIRAWEGCDECSAFERETTISKDFLFVLVYSVKPNANGSAHRRFTGDGNLKNQLVTNTFPKDEVGFPIVKFRLAPIRPRKELRKFPIEAEEYLLPSLF